MGSPERGHITPEQVQGHKGGLAPEITEKLADMALISERHADMSLALGQARLMLSALIDRRPEFRGSAAELRAKLKQLEHLQATLGMEVMKYSHHYEDATASML